MHNDSENTNPKIDPPTSSLLPSDRLTLQEVSPAPAAESQLSLFPLPHPVETPGTGARTQRGLTPVRQSQVLARLQTARRSVSTADLRRLLTTSPPGGSSRGLRPLLRKLRRIGWVHLVSDGPGEAAERWRWLGWDGKRLRPARYRASGPLIESSQKTGINGSKRPKNDTKKPKNDMKTKRATINNRDNK